jgi:predicted nucleic acid-binding protein
MSFLLDTCVVSEGTKDFRDSNVQSWLKMTANDRNYLSAITLGELTFGVGCLPDGAKRKRLETWLAGLIFETPSERILAIDKNVALLWGTLRSRYPNAKFTDGQIAATAFVHGLTLVTRNVRDFPFTGLAVFNPWSK